MTPGAIWGHFVKFVLAPSSGVPGDAPCTWIGEVEEVNRNDVTACLATLVR